MHTPVWGGRGGGGDELEPRPRDKGPTNHVLKDGPGPKIWIGVKKPKE